MKKIIVLLLIMSTSLAFSQENANSPTQDIGVTAEFKTWKTKYLSLLKSADINVNACNTIIKKHTYLNRRGEKMYDSDTFTKQEKITFNKNLDILDSKLKQIGELEDNRNLYLYWIDLATIKESAQSYNLSTFYNTTSRCY